MTSAAIFSTSPRAYLRLLLAGAAYAVAHRLGYLLLVPGVEVAAVWPASGMALAALLVTPRPEWPATVLVISLVNFASNLWANGSISISLGFLAANLLELGIGAWALTRFTSGVPTFTRVREVTTLVAVATVGNAIASLLGGVTVTQQTTGPFWVTYLTFWTADALGLLIVAPLVVTWSSARTAIRDWRSHRALEVAAFLAAWIGAAWLIFIQGAASHGFVPLPYALVALLVWAALRLGLPVVTIALTLLAVIASVSAAMQDGRTPLGGESLIERLLLAQTYLAITSATGLLLVASDAERDAAARGALADQANRRLAEEQLRRANRALRTRSSCNQVLVRSTTEADLLAEACLAIVHEGGYRLAWVGFAEHDAQRTVRLAAQAGLEPAQLERLEVTWADTANGRDPTGTAVRTGTPVVRRDFLSDAMTEPWRKDAVALGYSAALALPLKSAGETYGALTVCAREPDAFDLEETALLQELANDLTYGIDALRERAAREQAERTLAVSEDLFRTAMHHSPIGKGIVSPDGHWVDVNPALCQIVGYTREELLATTFASITHADDVDASLEAFRRLLMGQGETYETLKRYVCKDGTVRSVQLNVALVRNSDGTPRHFVSQIQDVTERTRGEIERSRLVHDLGERVKELTLLHRTARLLQLNREFNHQLLEDLVAFMPAAWEHPEVCEARIIYDGFTAATPGWIETPWRQRMAFRTSDGKSGAIEVAYREERPLAAEGPFLPEEQRLLESLADMLAAHINRGRAESALRDSEERFRQLTENIREVFWLKDALTGEVLYVSPGFERLWGRSPDALYASAEAWFEHVHPDDRERVRQAANERTLRGDYDEQYRTVRPDGSVCWVHDRAFPIRDDSGRVFRIAGVAEDVTARRAIEEQFRQSQKLEAIGQLAGGIAHDFNNLLTVINGYTQVLLAEGRDPSAQRDLEQIQHAGTRAASLTRQLLAFGRQSILEVTVLDLSRLLTQAERILERVLRGDIVLTIDTPASLYRVKADPGQIERVIINLAVNARDAMPQGGRLTLGTRNIELSTRDLVHHPGASAGRYAVLSVSDTGSGMTELVKARLFEPFFTTKGPDRGTGLGLAVVDGVIRQSGGFIEVDSAPGRGTTFRIYLPAIEGLEPDVVDEAVDGPESGTETLVLAEDDEAVRQFAGTALRRLGYRVLVAVDGADAVELIRHAAQPIALLVTDLVMPGLNGPQVIEVLRKEGRAPHVLFISGYAPETVMQREITSGAVNFLRKPFTAGTLARKVREVLDTRS